MSKKQLETTLQMYKDDATRQEALIDTLKAELEARKKIVATALAVSIGMDQLEAQEGYDSLADSIKQIEGETDKDSAPMQAQLAWMKALLGLRTQIKEYCG